FLKTMGTFLAVRSTVRPGPFRPGEGWLWICFGLPRYVGLSPIALGRKLCLESIRGIDGCHSLDIDHSLTEILDFAYFVLCGVTQRGTPVRTPCRSVFAPRGVPRQVAD